MHNWVQFGDNTFMVIFKIKKIREAKKITLYKLAQETGISRAYLRNLENNKNCNPTILVLCKIAIALKVDIKDLFDFVP